MLGAVRNERDSQRRSAHFATLLSASTKPYFRDGRKLYEIPVAVAGSWVKQGQRFSITAEDIGTIVLNFGKRKNEQVVIDYEHASEMPEVARGGPVPAAGWIHNLQVGGASRSGELGARVEWTPEAEKLIQSGQYRFFSPAIDWSFRDKATGEPQGATLTSGALTNHPFLEELPPIMLTEGSAGAIVAGELGRCDLLTAGAEVSAKAKSAMGKQNLSYKEALKKVLASDNGLEKRYRAEMCNPRPDLTSDPQLRSKEEQKLLSDIADVMLRQGLDYRSARRSVQGRKRL